MTTTEHDTLVTGTVNARRFSRCLREMKRQKSPCCDRNVSGRPAEKDLLMAVADVEAKYVSRWEVTSSINRKVTVNR